MVRQEYWSYGQRQIFHQIPEERVVEHSVVVVLIPETPQPGCEGAAMFKNAQAT